MFKEIKKQYLKSQEDLDKTREDKKATKEFLEERRKKDEEEFLKPVLDKESEEKKVLESQKKALLAELAKELESFKKSQSPEMASALLDAFVFVSSIDKKMPESLKDKSQPLYEYFLGVADIESAVTFLKARVGTLFKESELVERRQKYIEYLAENTTPVVETNSKYIMGYGEYIEDIVKLFEVCGKLDRQSAPKGFEGIYYSEETALLMAMGALDEFGDVAKHLYYVPPFGTQDSDRETLVYYHNKGYEESGMGTQKEEKTAKEKDV